MPDPNVKKRVFESYLATITNSVNARVWQNFYADVNGQKQDVLNGGVLSCAYFVSGILKQFGLIGSIHMTVDSTVKDLKESSWQVVEQPRPGSVVVYEPLEFDDGVHAHVGFCIGNGEAISTSEKLMVPVRHDLYAGSNGHPRKITATYWLEGLDKR